MNRLSEKLRSDGFVVLDSCLTGDELNEFRNVIIEFFKKRNCDLESDIISDFLPDALGQVAGLRKILSKSEMFKEIEEIVGFKPYYCHHSDIHINKTAKWHRDSIKKDNYFDFCKTDIYANQYNVYKIGIYFQDHNGISGLSVVPGSHSQDIELDISKAEDIHSRAGQVILFDTRIYHKGVESLEEIDCDGDRLSLFMTLAQNNECANEFVAGTIWRQNKQLNRVKYIIDPQLEADLSSNKIPYIEYEESPQPSILSALSQVDSLKKELRLKNRECNRLAIKKKKLEEEKKKLKKYLERTPSWFIYRAVRKVKRNIFPSNEKV